MLGPQALGWEEVLWPVLAGLGEVGEGNCVVTIGNLYLRHFLGNADLLDRDRQPRQAQYRERKVSLREMRTAGN